MNHYCTSSESDVSYVPEALYMRLRSAIQGTIHDIPTSQAGLALMRRAAEGRIDAELLVTYIEAFLAYTREERSKNRAVERELADLKASLAAVGDLFRKITEAT